MLFLKLHFKSFGPLPAEAFLPNACPCLSLSIPRRSMISNYVMICEWLSKLCIRFGPKNYLYIILWIHYSATMPWSEEGL